MTGGWGRWARGVTVASLLAPAWAVAAEPATLLLSSAPTNEAAQAKWAKLIKLVPALKPLTPSIGAVGDGSVGLRLSGEPAGLEKLCRMLSAKGQFCRLRSGAPNPVVPPAAPPQTATLLLSSAPTNEAAQAKWAKLVKLVPALKPLTPSIGAVGDGSVGLRLSGEPAGLEKLCRMLSAKEQFCRLRAGAPAPAEAAAAPVRVDKEPAAMAASAAPTAPQPAPSPEQTVTLLLSSAKSMEAARLKWSRLIRSQPLLARLAPTMVTVGDPAHGGYVSVRVSGPQRKLANLCVSLTEKGQYCLLHGQLAPVHFNAATGTAPRPVSAGRR